MKCLQKSTNQNGMIIVLSIASLLALTVAGGLAYICWNVWYSSISILLIGSILFYLYLYWRVALMIVFLNKLERSAGNILSEKPLIDLWVEQEKGTYFDLFCNVKKGEMAYMVVGPYGLVVSPLSGGTIGRGRYFSSTYQIIADAETYESQHVKMIIKAPVVISGLMRLFPKIHIIHWDVHVTPKKLAELKSSGLEKEEKTIATIWRTANDC